MLQFANVATELFLWRPDELHDPFGLVFIYKGVDVVVVTSGGLGDFEVMFG